MAAEKDAIKKIKEAEHASEELNSLKVKLAEVNAEKLKVDKELLSKKQIADVKSQELTLLECSIKADSEKLEKTRNALKLTQSQLDEKTKAAEAREKLLKEPTEKMARYIVENDPGDPELLSIAAGALGRNPSDVTNWLNAYLANPNEDTGKVLYRITGMDGSDLLPLLKSSNAQFLIQEDDYLGGKYSLAPLDDGDPATYNNILSISMLNGKVSYVSFVDNIYLLKIINENNASAWQYFLLNTYANNSYILIDGPHKVKNVDLTKWTLSNYAIEILENMAQVLQGKEKEKNIISLSNLKKLNIERIEKTISENEELEESVYLSEAIDNFKAESYKPAGFEGLNDDLEKAFLSYVVSGVKNLQSSQPISPETGTIIAAALSSDLELGEFVENVIENDDQEEKVGYLRVKYGRGRVYSSARLLNVKFVKAPGAFEWQLSGVESYRLND